MLANKVLQGQSTFLASPLPWMLSKTKGTFVAITFESTQFGIVDADSGTFYFLGQD